MWIAKLKVKHESRIASRTKKHQVMCYSILLGKDTKNSLISGLHYVIGNEKSVSNFIKDLKLDGGVRKLEIKDNVFSMLEDAKRIPSYFLESNIFFVKPVLSNIDGFEYWEIASWEKDTINNFINSLESNKIGVELINIAKTNLTEIHFPKIMPKLTKNQKKAIELAISAGYYKYPRKANLDELATKMHIGISTYQEHLRKAENKIFPLFSEFE